MFNQNSGYVGNSRSVRSYDAIENFEVPLTLINKSLLEDFFSQNEEYKELENITVALFKYMAKRTGRSSWHHTGSMFNKTDHYELREVCDKILELGYDKCENDYKEDMRLEKEKSTADLDLMVIMSELWGGSRKRPKFIGYETFLAVAKGSFAYPVTDSENSRYKVDANKNKVLKSVKIEEYYKLVKEYKEFKSNKTAVNRMVKSLLK